MKSHSSVASPKAEHSSLEGYLRQHLTDHELSRPLIFSASQWDICTAAATEIAATLHNMSKDVWVALWADNTPMRDVGWTTSHRLAALTMSPARDQRVRSALRAFGLPRSAFPKPPIRRWRPEDVLPQVQDLTRPAIRQLHYRGAPIGKAILQVHPDQSTPSNDHYSWPRAWVEASIESYAYVFDQVRALMVSSERTCLSVFNGRFLHDAAAAAAAESLGVPVLYFDYGGNDTDFDLTVDATHDWSALQTRMKTLYQTWDPHERDVVGGKWFEDRRQHADRTNSLFTESQTIGQGIDTPKDKRTVVYFSSSGDEIAELDVDWADFFYGQEAALSAVAQACREIGNTYFVVRTHPHKRKKPRQDVIDWHEAVKDARPDLHLDEWSDVDSYTLMEQADVVVTFGSTTGVEAAYARRPVIVMGPSAYDELGCAVRVRTQEELLAAIQGARAGDWPGAVSYGLMMNRRGFTTEFLTDSDGVRRLSGHVITDAHAVVLKVCHWWAERHKRRLTQR